VFPCSPTSQRQWSVVSGQWSVKPAKKQQALAVPSGLNLHAGQRGALFLGLDHAGGGPVHIQHVVRETVSGFERKFTDGDAPPGSNVRPAEILDNPARRSEQLINDLARFFLRLLGHLAYTCRNYTYFP